jgi:hypothetical protein
MTISLKEKTLFVAWQDQQSRSWFPIGKLTYDGKKYQFIYLNGAKTAQEKCGFKPLFSFPNFKEIYTSNYLFPLFANRLMSRSRFEYQNLINSLDLSEDEDDLIAILARSEGEKTTDSLRVFSYPEVRNDGQYMLHFLAHGLRYLHQDAIQKITSLNKGDLLWLAHEAHNSWDEKAITLNTHDHYIVGYLPRYLVDNIFDILRKNPSLIQVKVVKINLEPIPIKYRLLCEIIYSGIDHYQPFQQEIYQPIYQKEMVKA